MKAIKILFVLGCIVAFFVYVGSRGSTGTRSTQHATSAVSQVDELPTNQQPKTPARPADLVVNSASAIYSLYNTNEVNADSKLKGKIGAVSGIVEKVGKDILNKPYVLLRGSDVFGVQCFFDDPTEIIRIADFKPGQAVVVAGECTGKVGNVLLMDCWIYDTSKTPK